MDLFSGTTLAATAPGAITVQGTGSTTGMAPTFGVEIANDGSNAPVTFTGNATLTANAAGIEADTPLNAGNFKTPTLVIHGQLDLRVPVNHGIELFNTLQNRGVPSKFLYFPDENHWVLKPQNSLFWYQTKKEWLGTYVKPGPGEAVATATTSAP